MEIVTQIKQICLETGNEWFLEHDFPKIALYDLQLKEKLEKENIFTFDERECICHRYTSDNCLCCDIEIQRVEELNKLNLAKHCNNIYDYDTESYAKSIWIIPEKIEGEIPGFILLKCCVDDFGISGGFTHKLEFACVRPKYRNRGILKNMISRIPKEWNIWLEVNSNNIKNIEKIWEKCGFVYYRTIHGHLIFKKYTF